MTCTVGGVTCGYWAKGRFFHARPPANTMTIESTVAKIGRSMKNRENMGKNPKSEAPNPKQTQKHKLK